MGRKKGWEDFPPVILVPETGCLLWQGPIMTNGYGTKGNQKAHRWAWELKYGPIPSGMAIDHVRTRGCIYRHCVNTDHMELVTPTENNRRANLGKRSKYCRRGHEFAVVGWYNQQKGRACKACIKERRNGLH
jgi:hypothetical protein